LIWWTLLRARGELLFAEGELGNGRLVFVGARLVELLVPAVQGVGAVASAEILQDGRL